MYETLLYEIEDGVCTITLNRPESLNALNGTMLNELPLACEQAAADNDVRVVILTGSGRLFCAGGDLKDTGPWRHPQPRAEHLLVDQPGARLSAPAPDAEADDCGDQRRRGGRRCSLTLACDLRYMSTTAYLYTAFLKVGFSGDFGGTWTLPRLVGMGKAREMYLLPDRVQAEEALSLGLANGVYDPEELMPNVLQVAAQLRDSHPGAIAQIKNNLNDAFTIPLSEAVRREADRMRRVGESEDSIEARRAFVEKRRPVFKGR